MKKSIKTLLTTILLAVATMLSLTACGDGADAGNDGARTYKVAIVKYVDDASLNQIEDAIVAQLQAKEADLAASIIKTRRSSVNSWHFLVWG